VKRSRLWRELEAGDTRPLRVLRVAILLGGIFFLGFAAVLFLDWQHQIVLALLTLCIATWINRSSKSHLVTLTLVLLSCYSTFRYGFWRFSSVLAYFRDPGTNWTGLTALFIWMLLLAECYAFLVLLLGYLQTLWPLRRMPVPLPNDPEEWPAIDLLIPTLNEPLSVVRFTALAAMNIDWPPDRLHVYILDDGKREDFRAFAEEAGIGYKSRDDNQHAKAGNINHALKDLTSPFVAVFDCDHVPTRSFLQLTMGWFLRDQKLAMLQTPQHSYSPDPFDRNLDQFRIIPNEDELFYGVVQDGNDFWNATSFCGSCAVLRRAALDEAGGVAVETVTEDAHTSLRMQMHGWNTAYINIPQAAGLANERLSGHVRQRVRWARGMVQILRIENPLFAHGLKPAQRLCYFNAMLHFLYALPRLIFLTAPMIYLVFGIKNLPGFWLAILAYAIPHLFLARLANSRIQGQHRHSFWNEIYETVLAPYILLPTLFAFINPRSGSFNVTPKGGVVDHDFFDARIARPFLLLGAFNIFGLLCAIARFFPLPTLAVPSWMSFVNWPASLYHGGNAGTIWVNVLWALFNLMILGVATAVAWESQQRRRSVRVAMEVPSDVILADGSMIQGITSDLSSGGVRTRMDYALKAEIGDAVKFVFPVLDGSATLPATIISVDGIEMRAQFGSLTLQEDEALTMILYSRADAWLDVDEGRETERPMRSIGRILRLSLRGFAQTAGISKSRKATAKSRLAASVVPIALFALATCFSSWIARAAETGTPAIKSSMKVAKPALQPMAAGQFANSFTLADAGVPDAINLRGVDASHSVYFSMPRNQLVKTATMKLRYHFSPGLLPGISHLNVSLNGTLLTTLVVTAAPNSTAGKSPLESQVNLPSDLLVHDNQLTFEFIGHYAQQCEDATNSTLWAHVDSSSSIEITGSVLPLANDLKVLPLPFYDNGVDLHPMVPIVFLTKPTPKAMQAAGIIASWFGVLNSYHPVRFTVSVGSIPTGNAIVIAADSSQLPSSLGVGAVSGSTVAMVTNPSDPYSNLLIVTGTSGDELLTAAMALTLHGDTWQGPQISIRNFTPPDPRKPDDAPRWMSTSWDSGEMIQTGDLQGDGSVPASIFFRVPPDLSFAGKQNLAFHLTYRYNGVPLGTGSSLQIYLNGAFISSTPLPHTDNASTVLETVVPIPVVNLRPFSNTLTFQFVFQAPKSEQCGTAVPTNLQGAILKDSHLDISDIPHSAVLPNLELFANAGYPFTRKADLADTAVVLPDDPSVEELELFLDLMGHFGAMTGYPGLQVTVTNAAGMTKDGTMDLLLLGTAQDQPALKLLGGSLPVRFEPGGMQIHDTQSLFNPAAWWRNRGSQHSQSGQLQTEGGLPDALIEAVQWPGRSSRTVVAVVLRDRAAMPSFLAAFLGASQSSDIAQSVSVLHGERFSSYRIGGGAYRVGQISLLTRVTTIFQEAPWLIAVVTVIFCFLMAALIQTMLRRHARLRLLGDDD
jgi:cellulose synthase (UDP-forming)